MYKLVKRNVSDCSFQTVETVYRTSQIELYDISDIDCRIIHFKWLTLTRLLNYLVK